MKKRMAPTPGLSTAPAGEITGADYRSASNEAALSASVHSMSAAPEIEGLRDPYGRLHDYVRISVTDRCNLRCVYCMPEEGLPFFPTDKVLSADEIIHLVENFARMGITKIRLTGGEPLLRKDILTIARGISNVPGITDLSVTTNGLALPRLAGPLWEAGVKRLNISLDTFDPERYKTITRGGNLKQLLKGLEAAAALPFEQIKLNTVVIRGQNEDELADFLRYTLDHPVNVRFIEFMPIAADHAQWEKQYFGIEQVFDVCQAEGWAYDPIQFAGNGPSENFRIRGARGSFGLIHPVSCQFCEGCNRLRVTADGCLKSCLFWDDEDNIRTEILDFRAFSEKVQRVLAAKPKNHEMALDRQEEVKDKRPTWRHMSQIGG